VTERRGSRAVEDPLHGLGVLACPVVGWRWAYPTSKPCPKARWRACRSRLRRRWKPARAAPQAIPATRIDQSPAMRSRLPGWAGTASATAAAGYDGRRARGCAIAGATGAAGCGAGWATARSGCVTGAGAAIPGAATPGCRKRWHSAICFSTSARSSRRQVGRLLQELTEAGDGVFVAVVLLETSRLVEDVVEVVACRRTARRAVATPAAGSPARQAVLAALSLALTVDCLRLLPGPSRPRETEVFPPRESGATESLDCHITVLVPCPIMRSDVEVPRP
jgi:hypothetical protein